MLMWGRGAIKKFKIRFKREKRKLCSTACVLYSDAYTLKKKGSQKGGTTNFYTPNGAGMKCLAYFLLDGDRH